MKNVRFIPLVLCVLLSAGALRSQTETFYQHFADATLRIDYHRTGNRQGNGVQDIRYRQLSCWSGSLTQLLDPFDNGDFRIEVRDAVSGRLLYSRCYNNLFQEYRDTPTGKDSVAWFEEVVRVPYPLHAVDICWMERGKDQRFHDQAVYRFDPDTSQTTRPSAITCRHDEVHRQLDIVIVPEGYGADDTAKMRQDLKSFRDIILSTEPFASRAKDLHIWCIETVGKSTGITDPQKGIHVNSLVGSSYNTFDCDRYLMTMHLFQLHDAIGETPCDQIVIMANSSTYGGGAIYNFYAMSSLTKMAYRVLPHEMGHSIGGLADEYVDEELSYGDMHTAQQEPTEPNITTLVDFGAKWKEMLPAGTPIPTPYDQSANPLENGPLGVYEGAGYHSKGIYRPTMHCMMRDYAPFCPVCRKRLNDIIDLYSK